MFLQLKNLSGVEFPILGLGRVKAHSSDQFFYDIHPEQFTSRRGPNIGTALAAQAAAGNIYYQFVLEASDYGAGRVGVKTLHVSYAAGDFTAEDVSQVFTDSTALPAGAMLLQAHLDVHAVVDDATATVSAAVVKSGYDSDDDAFDASENVLANATRRQLTTLAVGSDIGGKKLSLTLTLTDGNVDTLNAGDLELAVSYIVVPTL